MSYELVLLGTGGEVELVYKMNCANDDAARGMTLTIETPYEG